MKLKKASIITKIVVIALLVYGLVTLAVLMGKINDDSGVLKTGMAYERNYKFPMPEIKK